MKDLIQYLQEKYPVSEVKESPFDKDFILVKTVVEYRSIASDVPNCGPSQIPTIKVQNIHIDTVKLSIYEKSKK